MVFAEELPRRRLGSSQEPCLQSIAASICPTHCSVHLRLHIATKEALDAAAVASVWMRLEFRLLADASLCSPTPSQQNNTPTSRLHLNAQTGPESDQVSMTLFFVTPRNSPMMKNMLSEPE